MTEAEAVTITATLAGIEQVNARFADDSATKDGEISLASATGVTTVTVANSPSVGTVSGLAKIANIGVQNQNADVTFSGSTATSLNITVDTVGNLDNPIGDVVIDMDDAAATTHALTLNNVNVEIKETASSATTVSVAATGENLVEATNYDLVTGLTITGAGSVEFDAATVLDALKTVNASGNTGGFTLTADEDITTVTGGDGNDSVTADDLTAKSSFTMGAGDDTVTLDVIAAETTVSLGAGNDSFTVGAADQKMTVTGGAGDDTIDVSARSGVVNAISIKGEAGDDYIDVGAGALNADDVIDGGDGTDTLAITTGANFTADFVNFEALEIAGGTTTYDLSVDTDIKNVYLTDATLAGAVLLDNAAKDVAVTIRTSDGIALAAGTLEFDLKTDSATDTHTLTLTTNDDADKAVEGDGDDSLDAVTVTSYTADDIETLTIAATVTNVDGGNGATAGTHTAADYVHTITSLAAADLTTLKITGNASLDVTFAGTEVALKAVDASLSEGSVTVDLSTSGTTAAVSYYGAEGVDTVTASGNGDLLQGNGGADVLTLGAGDDTVRLATQADSKLVLNDSDADGAADEISGFDIVDLFGTAGADQIELATALYGAATAGQKADVLNAGTFGDGATDYVDAGAIVTAAALAADLEAFLGDGVDFFAASPTVDRSVAFAVLDDNDHDSLFVFIDVNNDGNFTAAADSVVLLTGVTTLAIGEVAFG